ncbi:hypothetical protein [Ectothiorhodospira shaposhnikovii]|uniref:hypothetical protein n=1 Tax=Ectothiorhodospira shaposhnikovii TaxID=1054 RepID=UPI001EE8ED93|nr:hypothetical protein [Ectothiorhodospira shaposhnikovii]MCG5512837.1 hypothetical protein [Ectothiorhodospira shaposhnikovii]
MLTTQEEHDRLERQSLTLEEKCQRVWDSCQTEEQRKVTLRFLALARCKIVCGRRPTLMEEATEAMRFICASARIDRRSA